ncbi:MAG TPA: FtsQ-type POTRA domain-containing protein [Thermoanaerobaculia bacterium]|nr:FtsQ-type POTRA domain-containing protein [Thermoanaerobaculia bacterium]
MDSESPFLRRGRVPVRRRKSPRWKRKILLSIGFAAAIAGLVRFLGGSLFALERFEIVGNQRARTEDILRALEPWRGRNLVMLDLAPAADRLAKVPWIERVTLAKRFPDGLSVRLTESRAVALWKTREALWWLDTRGGPIASYDPRADSTDYVVISGEQSTLPEAVGLLEDLHASVPEYFAALSEIDALPDGDFGMMDSIFRRPVRILRLDAPKKIDALLKARGLMQSRGWEARAIDLRFADRIILEGAYGAGHSL